MENSLEQWLKMHRGGEFEALSSDEVGQAEVLMGRLLSGVGDTDGEAWSKLGFRLESVNLQGISLLSLTEHPDAQRGRGAFLFRKSGVDSDDLLQAPHRFHDRDSGAIAAKLFIEKGFRAAGWNTLHRREADLARNEQSYFVAMARALAKTSLDGRIIQLHGFAQQKRRSAAGRKSDLIVSTGDRHPGSIASRLARCVATQLPYQVSLFPDQIDELGGTVNPVGRILRALPNQRPNHDRFLHLEMSARLRDDLIRSPAVRMSLLQCIGDRDG